LQKDGGKKIPRMVKTPSFNAGGGKKNQIAKRGGIKKKSHSAPLQKKKSRERRKGANGKTRLKRKESRQGGTSFCKEGNYSGREGGRNHRETDHLTGSRGLEGRRPEVWHREEKRGVLSGKNRRLSSDEKSEIKDGP